MDGARDAATRVRHLSCPPRHRTNKSAPLVLPWPLAVETHAPASTLAWHWPQLGACGLVSEDDRWVGDEFHANLLTGTDA